MATAPLVSIPNIKSFQIVNGSTVPLIDGTLVVTEPLASSRSETHAKLYITLKEEERESVPIPSLTDDSKPANETSEEEGKYKEEKGQPRQLLIPLFDDSFVGSKGGEGLIWRFDLPEKELGIVEVRFDEDTDSIDALQFEKIMVYNGLLKTGIVGDADDFSRTIREAASSLSAKLTMKTAERNESKPAAEEDTEFSDITKSVVGGAETGTTKAAKVTSDIGNFVSRAAFNAGAWVSEKTGLGKSNNNYSTEEKSLPRETLDQTLEATEVVVKGIGAGIKDVGSTIGESASKVAEHDHGEQAKELVDQSRGAAANVGSMAVDVAKTTSVAWNAGEAGVGAAMVQEKKEEEDKKKEGGEEKKEEVVEENERKE